MKYETVVKDCPKHGPTIHYKVKGDNCCATICLKCHPLVEMAKQQACLELPEARRAHDAGAFPEGD